MRVITTIIATVALWTAGASSAAADTASGHDPIDVYLGYEIYLGPFHIMSLNAQANVGHADYHLATTFRTRGVAEAFFKSRLWATSEGALNGKGPLPREYKSDYDGKWGERSVQMTFGEDGPLSINVHPPYGEDNRDPVTDDLRRGTLDPQTAALVALVLADKSELCQSRLPVFDGRRRYNLNLKYIGRTAVKSGNNGVYEGLAHKCELVYERVAGFDKEWAKEHDAEEIKPVKVWVAEIDGLYVPVRMETPTSLGTGVVELSDVSIAPMVGREARLPIPRPEAGVNG